MHYYQFSIGDYRAATAHLTNEEDLAYRRLLDMYYDTEAKIPTDTQWVARRIRMDAAVVLSVLNDMFKEHEDGWFHARCHEVIDQYHAMAEKNRVNGRLGGRKKNPVGNPAVTDSEPIAKATINQELLTNKLIDKNKRGSRLAQDFVLSKEWIEFCVSQRPDLHPAQTFDQFKDYWTAQAGQKGVKLDWDATWRNWVRSTHAPKRNPADNIRITVPASNEPDPELLKIIRDEKTTRPPTPEERAILNSYRRKA